MKKKVQVFFIHGGETFKSHKDYVAWLQKKKISLEEKKSWKDDFEKKLKKECECIRPVMPCKYNAKYNEWEIYFEKFIPHLQNNVIFIGTSLGGIFLAKYLSENRFPKKILSTYLIAAPYDNTLPNDDLVGGFRLPSDLSLFVKNSPKIKLIYGEDDPIVPLSHAQKYMQKIPSAEISIFKNKGVHFQIETFPEIIKMVKSDLK